MSASDTMHSARPKRVITSRSTSAPPKITSSRPCGHAGRSARSCHALGAEDVAPPSDRACGRAPRGGSAPGRTGSAPTPGWPASRRCRPGRRDGRRLPSFASDGNPLVARSSSAPMARRAASTSSAVGGSPLQEALGEPHAADVEGDRRRSHRRPCVTISVEPPPMSTTTVCAADGRQVGRGARVRQPPFFVPVRSSAGTPTISDAGPRNASPLAASRTADVATRRARATPLGVHDGAVLPERRRACAPSPRAGAGGWRRRPAPSRVIRISRAAHVARRPGPRAAAWSSSRSRPRRARRRRRSSPSSITAARRAHVSGRVSSSRCRHPRPDRVVPAGQPPGQVGVQALDPLARAAHAPARARPGPVGRDQRVALGRVAAVARRPAPPRPPALRLAHAARPPRAGRPRARSSGSTSQ